MSDKLNTNQLRLREVERQDCEILFHWRNLPEIIELGSSQKSVQWNEHEAWFNSALKSPKCIIYIITFKKEPIGQLRFDREDQQRADISIYIVSQFIGKGLGRVAIREACKKLFNEKGSIREINALIREENIASIKAFERVGFKVNNAYRDKPFHHHLTLERRCL